MLSGSAGVRLQHAAHLEPIGQVLQCRTRRVHPRAVDDKPVALVVVGAAPVLRQIERAIGELKKNSTSFIAFDSVYTTRGTGPSVPADAAATRAGRDTWTCRRPNTGCCSRSGIGPASVVAARGDAAWHVLVDGHQQPFAADVVIAGADRAALADLLLDFHASLARVGACNRRSIVVRLGRVPDGTLLARMAGNTGAEAWAGDRLIAIAAVATRRSCCRPRAGHCHGAERHAVVEDAGVAAHDRSPGGEGRPHGADAR